MHNNSNKISIQHSNYKINYIYTHKQLVTMASEEPSMNQRVISPFWILRAVVGDRLNWATDIFDETLGLLLNENDGLRDVGLRLTKTLYLDIGGVYVEINLGFRKRLERGLRRSGDVIKQRIDDDEIGGICWISASVLLFWAVRLLRYWICGVYEPKNDDTWKEHQHG